MGVVKELLHEGQSVKDSNGNELNSPKKSQDIAMEYTGWLYDATKPENKGKEFDSSVKRKQDLEVKIGNGEVIRGWDDGILGDNPPETAMKVGEKARLTISGDYAYGARGYPGLIPPNATLVFDVVLKAIIPKKEGQATAGA